MRIGIDARLWDETGVGRYIRNLVWQLEKIDKKNEYVLFIKKGIKKSDLGITNERFRIVETDIHWHTIEEQLLFYKVLDNELLDLVHFPYFSVPILYTRPFVITIHDLIINHFPTGKASTLPLPLYFAKRLAYQFIMKQAAKKASKILTVSEATKSEIIDHLKVPAEKIVVTYEGVDERIAKSSEQKASGRDTYFLYVGNAYPHKNLERLVDAFEKIVQEKPQCKLFLVGKDDYFYNRLHEKISSLQLDNSIIFCKNVRDEELSRLYSSATALIAPSLMEGFGLPGLEAMQHKTLVIASDIPVYKEVYQDAALYFDPLDVSSLRATILRVLEKEETHTEQREKGLKLVKTFSWEKMAQETARIYESSIGV
jgi:glycosyltransferase involved in cell wall biosynthesis